MPSEKIHLLACKGDVDKVVPKKREEGEIEISNAATAVNFQQYARNHARFI